MCFYWELAVCEYIDGNNGVGIDDREIWSKGER